MSEKGRTEEFLDLYRKLEHIGREIYFPNSNNAPIIGRLQALPVLKEFKEEIDYCRVVRNFLVHNPKVNVLILLHHQKKCLMYFANV